MFPLGMTVITPAALELLQQLNLSPAYFLTRHVSADWGDLDEHDNQANDRALVSGTRIMSSYNLPNGDKVWVITEADRSATTILLPEDY